MCMYGYLAPYFIDHVCCPILQVMFVVLDLHNQGIFGEQVPYK